MSVKGAAPVMAPKCAMSALPPPCVQLKKSMMKLGAEVSLDGLHKSVDRHRNGLVHYATRVQNAGLRICYDDSKHII